MSKLNWNRLAFFGLGAVFGGYILGAAAAVLKPRSVR